MSRLNHRLFPIRKTSYKPNLQTPKNTGKLSLVFVSGCSRSYPKKAPFLVVPEGGLGSPGPRENLPPEGAVIDE